MGVEGRRRTLGTRRTAMEENRAMILAGEIGATRTRLAAFQKEGSRLKLEVEETYLSLEHASVSAFIAAFINAEGIPVHQTYVRGARLVWHGPRSEPHVA